MKQISHHRQKIKLKQIPKKRLIPPTYTLRAIKELLIVYTCIQSKQEYEKTVSSTAARDFVRWLEAREKINDLRIHKRFYGIE